MGFGFRFISGKFQGGEFELPGEGEIVVGRATDLDLVLSEDMVSRKHAKLSWTEGSVAVTDLGSTNGTFVNGEKVRRAELKRGDRLLIGTSILKVVDADELVRTGIVPGKINAVLEEIAGRAPQTSTMSGELEEVPLPDLLQLFATNKKSGVFIISGAHRGKVYIKQGQLLYAVIGGETTQQKPMKAICRMLLWDKGAFTLEPYDESVAFPEVFEESTESVLIEALRQADEVKRIMLTLPPLESNVELCVPLTPSLTELSKSELETLQLAINFVQLKTVVDKTPGPDHEALTNLQKLIRGGYLQLK